MMSSKMGNSQQLGFGMTRSQGPSMVGEGGSLKNKLAGLEVSIPNIEMENINNKSNHRTEFA